MKNTFSSLSFGLAVLATFAAVVTPCHADRYNKITPCRLVDTRPNQPAALPIKGVLGNGSERAIAFRGYCMIPSTATAVVTNLTVVNHTAAGYLKIYPGDIGAPPVSNINFAPGTFAIANQAIVPLSAPSSGLPDAILNAAIGGTTDAIIDVSGYFEKTNGALFHTITPCRLLDTRSYPGNPAPLQPPNYTRIAGGQTISFRAEDNSTCPIPRGAVAIFANLTAVGPAGGGFFTIYPADVTQPGVSALNFQTGDSAIPNGVIVPLATGTQAGTPDLKLYSGVFAADAILDISGYFQ